MLWCPGHRSCTVPSLTSFIQCHTVLGLRCNYCCINYTNYLSPLHTRSLIPGFEHVFDSIEVYRMKQGGQSRWTRISRCFDRRLPPPPQPIDEEIREMGGTTSAFDWRPEEVQAQKAPITIQERIASLMEHNHRLQCELEYLVGLSEAVMAIVPQVASPVETLLYALDYMSRSDLTKDQSEPEAYRHRRAGAMNGEFSDLGEEGGIITVKHVAEQCWTADWANRNSRSRAKNGRMHSLNGRPF